MASDRNLIVKTSLNAATYYIAYEGTSGQIPFDLEGVYTTPKKAEYAIEMYLLKRDAGKVKPKAGDTLGNSERE